MSVRDLYVPFTCGHCRELIDQSTDYAGEIVWRVGDEKEVALHPRCSIEWDKERGVELYCVDCETIQGECEARCPKGFGGIHVFVEVAS